MNSEFISELARRLARDVPENARILRADLEENFAALLQSAFARLDLVTREEFAVQQRVLAATRAKLDAIEEALARYEAASAADPDQPR